MHDFLEYFLLYAKESYMIHCAILSVIIPWVINKINRTLHNHGDPPWKKEESDE